MSDAQHTDALARALHEITDGTNGEGTAGWPERHREVYALAIEEVADAIHSKATPEVHAALLDALTRHGVLAPRFGVLSFANRQVVPVDSEGAATHAAQRLGGATMRRLVTRWGPTP